jgi:hypothetical protein
MNSSQPFQEHPVYKLVVQYCQSNFKKSLTADAAFSSATLDNKPGNQASKYVTRGVIS